MSTDYCMRQPSCHACKGKCAWYREYEKKGFEKSSPRKRRKRRGGSKKYIKI